MSDARPGPLAPSPSGPSDEALAAANASALPAVARPASRWLLPAGLAGIGLLGVVTFAALYDPAGPPVGTEALPVSTRAPSSSADLPPPPTLAPAPAPLAAPLPVAIPEPIVQAPPPPAPTPVVQPPVTPPRAPAPVLGFDASVPDRPAAAVDNPSGITRGIPGNSRQATNEAFFDRVSRSRTETVGTERLTSTDLVVPQGTIITGVLETAINSDLPGLVRAVVSRDVRGLDGSKILIPRGSRLIGQYSNGVALGQSRAFVIWTRLLRADGVSVQLGSAATDPLGTAGLAGKVNSHFLRRFGAAALLSVITSGLDYLVATAQSGQGVVIGNPQQATQLAGIALQREIDIPPTIKVMQGTPVRVFVAKDLDFSLERATPARSVSVGANTPAPPPPPAANP